MKKNRPNTKVNKNLYDLISDLSTMVRLSDNIRYIDEETKTVFFFDPAMQKQCPKNICRVSTKTGAIGINKKIFKKTSKYYRYFILCWAINMKYRPNLIEADSYATLDYMAKKYPLKELLAGFITMLNHSFTSSNCQRIQRVVQKIKERQHKKELDNFYDYNELV